MCCRKVGARVFPDPAKLDRVLLSFGDTAGLEASAVSSELSGHVYGLRKPIMWTFAYAAAKLRHWLLRTTFHRPLSQGILNKRQPWRTIIFERYCGCWPLQDTGSSVLTVDKTWGEEMEFSNFWGSSPYTLNLTTGTVLNSFSLHRAGMLRIIILGSRRD